MPGFSRNPAVTTYRLLVRHVEALVLANLTCLLAFCLVLPGPLGLAGLMGVVEGAWRRPRRRPGPAAFLAGIRRYWARATVLWLALVAVVPLAAGSLWYYGRVLAGRALLAVTVFELAFLCFLWVLWLYAAASVVVERARREGRVAGEMVGLVEGFSSDAGTAVAAWLLQVVLVATVAGFLAVGMALPVLYLVVAAGGASGRDA